MQLNRIINSPALMFMCAIPLTARTYASHAETCPLPVKAVAPEFPREAEIERISGIAIIEIKISKNGTVSSSFVSSGDNTFFESSLRAAEKWVFKQRIRPKITTLIFEYVSSQPGEHYKQQVIFFPPNKFKIISTLPTLPPKETFEVYKRE